MWGGLANRVDPTAGTPESAHESSDAGCVRQIRLVSEEGTEPLSVLEGEVGDARIVGFKLLALAPDALDLVDP